MTIKMTDPVPAIWYPVKSKFNKPLMADVRSAILTPKNTKNWYRENQ